MLTNEGLFSSPARIPSQAEIAEIIAASSKPSLRNLRITACYGELSRAIAATVGTENVNWCTFATWASKTAGRFIRLADLDDRIRAAIERCLGSAGLLSGLRESLRPLPGGLEPMDAHVIHAAKDLATETSAEVAAGNLTVFTELAPLFSALVDAMAEVKSGRRSALNRVMETLQLGATSQGGQDLLRRAVADYVDAMTTTDARRKAELMLRANAQVGAHEQIRLQPYIHNAMTASLAGRLSAVTLGKYVGTATESAGRLARLIDARLRPYQAALEQVWLQVSTSYLMTLELPNGTLWLGRDLPGIPGQPIFPPDLMELQDGELLRILRIYHADGLTARGSGASEWSHLSDRMRYILELFRSRQQDPTLFEPPFKAATLAAIRRGEVPLIGV